MQTFIVFGITVLFGVCLEKGQVLGARPGVSKTLHILTMNTWGLEHSSEDKETRMPAIASFLRESPHDIVFIQEAWHYTDFLLLKDTFPYSTFFGSPGSALCPVIKNDPASYNPGLPRVDDLKQTQNPWHRV